VPFWDQRDEFGDTNLLVVKPEEGRSLARALGPHSIILMKRHGATAVASTVQELVFRAVYACRNAEAQSLSKALGSIAPLSDGEVERAGLLCARQRFTSRTWEFWSKRLIQSGGDLDPLSTEDLASAGIQ
jgi:ribulose-5-phosphate 4-epimerase/fuculose-1-phosphate aldolase